MDGHWTTRQSGNADIWVDHAVEPTAARYTEDGVEPGDSKFKISTANLMSFYAVEVDEETGNAAVAFVCPWTRFQFEMKFARYFDFVGTSMADVTVSSGLLVPTERASGSAEFDWDGDKADRSILNMHGTWSYVVNHAVPFLT